jgi:hypothetical protein
MTPQFRQYLETALWSSVDDNGIPLDRDYSINDFDPDGLKCQELELNSFLSQAERLPDLYDHCDITDLAHDFWLTRNRHGAGFWDGDYPDHIGRELTKLSHTFREVGVFVNSDDSLSIEWG